MGYSTYTELFTGYEWDEMVVDKYITERKGEKNMSNASDIRELQDKQEHLTKGVVNAFEQVSFDYAKLQTMFFALLQDLGKTDTLSCSDCDEEVMRPLLSQLPVEKTCPMCGGDLTKDVSQTTVDDWDNGTTEEE